MSLIRARFEERSAEGRAALVPYVTAGFPDPDGTVALLGALSEAGADVIEVGIPFSDPLADGPTIQQSSFVALERGMTVRRALEAVRQFRSVHETPVVVFTYLNPVLRYGLTEFCRDAQDAGAQGILLTDLPAGADAEVEETVRDSGLDLVRLVAPTTSLERIPEVAEGCGGFLYYISRTGVTGARDHVSDTLGDEVRAVKQLVDLPVAVGFGISTPEQAAAVASVADGVVVGSALVRRLDEEGVAGAVRFVEALRRAIDRR